MPLSTHALIATDLNAFDPEDPSTHDAANLAVFRVVHEAILGLLGTNPSGEARAALDEVTGALHPKLRAVAACELASVLGGMVEEEAGDRSWTRVFRTAGFARALERGLLARDELALCLTWADNMSSKGLNVLFGGFTPVVAEATVQDVGVLLALNAIALEALEDPFLACLRQFNPEF